MDYSLHTILPRHHPRASTNYLVFQGGRRTSLSAISLLYSYSDTKLGFIPPLIGIAFCSSSSLALLRKHRYRSIILSFTKIYHRFTPRFISLQRLPHHSRPCVSYSFRKNIAKQKFLISIGNLSFEIYCFHVIILNCLWKAFDILGISSTPITALAIFFLTCIISIGVATGIRRMSILHKLLFPRGSKR